MSKRAFISHISEEAATAARVKAALDRDFLGLLNVFVSSDTESISAGEDWLESVRTALREYAMVAILCSPESIRRPWINFEAGAAWMRGIPLIPICLSGLLPRDLPLPLSLRQGIELHKAEGLRRLYQRVAGVLECKVPDRSFDTLAKEFLPTVSAIAAPPGTASRQLEEDRDARLRLAKALQHPDFEWRSLGRLAAAAAVSEERAADLLRSDPEVRFSKGKSGNLIAGLR